jgi:hypothetical protein
MFPAFLKIGLQKGVAEVQDKTQDRRKSERKRASIEAELYLESSVFKAQTVDVSDEGVRLELDKPIRFHIRVRIGDKLVSRKAIIVWSEEKEQPQSLSYGFKYIE